jgi:hypothetical protein
MIVDPLAAMASACIAIANGEANEIEMNWTVPVDGAYDESLTITVRREVRHLNFPAPEVGES